MLRDNKPASKNYDKEAMAQLLYPLQKGCCHKCGEQISPSYSSIHHALIHNNATNRKCFPALVHHPVNLVLMCGDCHQQYGCYMQIQNISVIFEIIDAIRKMEIDDDHIKTIKENIYKDYNKFINWCILLK
jgi:hypothetical protein